MLYRQAKNVHMVSNLHICPAIAIVDDIEKNAPLFAISENWLPLITSGQNMI
jgi:acetone carboxylase gamma subunit